MNQKTLILLVTVLLGFIAIAAVPKLFKQDESKKQLNKVSVDMSGFSEETVNKVEFGSSEEKKALNLTTGQWQINGEEADQIKVKLFFDGIQKSEVLKLASKNDENHKKFQVTGDDGVVLKFFTGEKENEFYVGKRGPSFGTFYIRKKGIKNVYLMRGSFFENLTWVEQEWKEEKKVEEEADEKIPKMNEL
ncbi:MAG: DUF4340 domain-containing protein [Patescibacteria group bacterium]|nr:DUF4340 domain-containing protein [Patescibacteria group bacterium]